MKTIITLKSKSTQLKLEEVKQCKSTQLHLFGINYIRVDELIAILTIIPSHVESVELSNGIFKSNRSILSIISLKNFSRIIQSIPDTVKALRLPFHSLRDDHAEIIATIGNFKAINLAANNISDIGVIYLSKNKYIKKVELNWNKKVTDTGVKALVSNNNIVSHDGLSKCALSKGNGDLLRKAIRETNPIRRARFKRELGINPFMPSLKCITGFFINSNMKKLNISNIPKDLKTFLHVNKR
jgi:Leucine Rich repeat